MCTDVDVGAFSPILSMLHFSIRPWFEVDCGTVVDYVLYVSHAGINMHVLYAGIRKLLMYICGAV